MNWGRCLLAAKAAFQAAFDDAAAGGLVAKQAPAPVHTIAAPAPLAAAPALGAGIPYGVSALNAVGGYPYAGLGYAGLGYAGLGYAGLGHTGLGYAGLGYAGHGYGGVHATNAAVGHAVAHTPLGVTPL